MHNNSDPKGRLVDLFYNNKHKLYTPFIATVNYLLGQEWMANNPTGMNINRLTNNIYVGFDNDYPVHPIINQDVFVCMLNEVTEVFNIPDEDYKWMIDRINNLPTKFEIST